MGGSPELSRSGTFFLSSRVVIAWHLCASRCFMVFGRGLSHSDVSVKWRGTSCYCSHLWINQDLRFLLASSSVLSRSMYRSVHLIRGILNRTVTSASLSCRRFKFSIRLDFTYCSSSKMKPLCTIKSSSPTRVRVYLSRL